MKNKKAIILVQAPHEVQNVLSLYDDIKLNYEDISFVCNTTDSYSYFFHEVGINKKTVIWQTPMFNHLKIWEWRSFSQLMRKESLALTVDTDIYYTCVCDFHFLCRLLHSPSSCNFIYRPGAELDLVGIPGLPKLKFYQIVYAYIKLIIQILYCMRRLYFVNNGALYNFRFAPAELGHQVLPRYYANNHIEKKYSYKPSCKNATKIALLLTEPYRNKFQTEDNYNEVNKRIVNELHGNGFKVVMKGHPRIGVCECIKDMVDEIIPNYVPSEFIDTTCFSLAIGFVSTSLCHIAHDLNSYTVIDMCEIIDYNSYEGWRRYINDNSHNNVKYLKSFNELI